MAGTFISHRGLWNDTYPENSLEAFKNSIDNNLAIELDIQLTKDNKLIVFHDNNLYRITGVNKKVKDVTLEEIKKLFINNTKYTIPTFEEVLKLVNGQVLLDIEIKHYNKPFKTVKCAKNLLQNYQGKYMIKSFHPLIPFRYKLSMKNISCGVLIGGYPPKISNLFINFLKYFKYSCFYKPDFVCLNINDIDNKIMKKIKKHNIPLYLHTIRNKDTLNEAIKISKTIVFEQLNITDLKEHL